MAATWYSFHLPVLGNGDGGIYSTQSRDIVMLEGFDAGVSFRSAHDPRSRITHTVISNSSDGAWPVTRHLDEQLWT